MSSTQSAPNFDLLNTLAKSLLSADVASGDTTLTLQNVTGISVNDFVYFGNLDQGTTEKGQVEGISGTTVTLSSAVLYAHRKFEEVTVVFGDQIDFLSAPNVDGTIPDDSLFSLLGTVDIVPNTLSTPYTDGAGGSNTWYKFRYHNSFDASTTDIADSFAVRGSDYGHYCQIEDIRREAGLTDVSEITDQMIDLERVAAESYVNGVIRNSYNLPLPFPYPGVVVKTCIMLAAGYVLSQQYGVLTPDMSRQGNSKIAQATSILTQIQSRSLILTDILGNSLLIQNAVVGWPNPLTSTTAGEEGGDNGPMVRVSTRF